MNCSTCRDPCHCHTVKCNGLAYNEDELIYLDISDFIPIDTSNTGRAVYRNLAGIKILVNLNIFRSETSIDDTIDKILKLYPCYYIVNCSCPYCLCDQAKERLKSESITRQKLIWSQEKRTETCIKCGHIHLQGNCGWMYPDGKHCHCTPSLKLETIYRKYPELTWKEKLLYFFCCELPDKQFALHTNRSDSFFNKSKIGDLFNLKFAKISDNNRGLQCTHTCQLWMHNRNRVIIELSCVETAILISILGKRNISLTNGLDLKHFGNTIYCCSQADYEKLNRKITSNI